MALMVPEIGRFVVELKIVDAPGRASSRTTTIDVGRALRHVSDGFRHGGCRAQPRAAHADIPSHDALATQTRRPPAYPSEIEREIDHAQQRGALQKVVVPPCPALLVRLRRALATAEPDLDEVAAVATSDVAMAATLLRWANGPMLAGLQPVQTVGRAMYRLGLERTAAVMTSFLARHAIPADAQPAALLGTFGRARLAMVSRASCQGFRSTWRTPSGLFSHVGMVVLMQGLPGYGGTLAEAAARFDHSFIETGNANHRTDHAVVGALVGAAVATGAFGHDRDPAPPRAGGAGRQARRRRGARWSPPAWWPSSWCAATRPAAGTRMAPARRRRTPVAGRLGRRRGALAAGLAPCSGRPEPRRATRADTLRAPCATSSCSTRPHLPEPRFVRGLPAPGVRRAPALAARDGTQPGRVPRPPLGGAAGRRARNWRTTSAPTRGPGLRAQRHDRGQHRRPLARAAAGRRGGRDRPRIRRLRDHLRTPVPRAARTSAG